MPQIPIIPQQPNCTIRTSQAATTNRAPTQTADFPETEESIDRDDNDDWISWQKVSGRGKKRAIPRIITVATIKRIDRKEQTTAQLR
jgi:hypothetical protein